MTDAEQVAEQEWRWRSYLWTSDTGEMMLENLLGVRNEAELAVREHAETAKRALEIQLGKVEIPQTRDWREWRAIHAHLFGNLYRWAGRPRTVRMWKEDQESPREFLPPEDLAEFLTRVFDRAKNADWATMERITFVTTAAGLFMDLNWAHPFREGNGRATQLFLDRITSTARWRLDFSRIARADWELACSSGTPMDYQPPKDLNLLLRAFSTITVVRESTAAPSPQPTDAIGPERDTTRAVPDRGPTSESGPGSGSAIGSAIHAAGLTTVEHSAFSSPAHIATPSLAPPEREQHYGPSL